MTQAPDFTKPVGASDEEVYGAWSRDRGEFGAMYAEFQYREMDRIVARIMRENTGIFAAAASSSGNVNTPPSWMNSGLPGVQGSPLPAAAPCAPPITPKFFPPTAVDGPSPTEVDRIWDAVVAASASSE